VVAETVDVVAVTPLHGSGLPRLHIPANIHVIAGSDGASGVPDLGALLTGGTAPLLASEAQGGTFQPDVLFRGFGGSPLLGASEGLAVYVDGMRANEPFGDIVNWDGLAPGAISGINVRQEYVVSPDGQRFLIDTSLQPLSPIAVVLNWKPTP